MPSLAVIVAMLRAQRFNHEYYAISIIAGSQILTL